jgi:hypothetical protein
MLMGALWILFGLAVILAPLFGQRAFLLPVVGISAGWVILLMGIFRVYIGWRMEKQREKAEEIRRLRREHALAVSEHNEKES